jgi:hypothetical protein
MKMENKTYRTTEKGMRLLRIYSKMYELVPPLTPITGVIDKNIRVGYNSSNDNGEGNDSDINFIANDKNHI